MKRHVKILVSVLVLSLLGMLMSGCGFIARAANGDIVLSGGTLYEVNDREKLDMEGVERVSIAGVSDEVTVQVGDEPMAVLTGQCRSIGDPVKLEVSKSGGKLTIEVKYPNNMIRSNNTNLVVTLPEGYTGNLGADTVSGSIEVAVLPLKLSEVHLNTVSGSIRFETTAFESLEVGTISGGVVIGGIASPIRVNTVSGEISLAYQAPADTDVVTVSGQVSARIPKDASFQIDFGSVSGNFRSNHSGIKVSKAGRGFSASVGDGGALIKVNTTSGGFTIDE